LSTFLQTEASNIDEEAALLVDAEKLRPGDYYNYRFLSVSVEMTLLEEEARGNSRIREYASTMLTRLDYFLNNQECDFMRSDTKEYQTTEDYLDKVFGISDSVRDKQLIVIDSSEINADTLELLTGVVSRLLFDYRKKMHGEQRRKSPVHLIMDEAHRYIKKDAQYILRENIFEKIAREGRKYSLYLLLSSQRPSELSGTVLSQCGNYIVHRIQNEFDLKYVYSVLPYFSSDFENKIKQSVPGEALIFGNCVPMPLQVKIPRANPDPDSDNCKISEEWFGHMETDSFERITNN
jgi:DNA helicase HerA-like ATPase